MLTALEQGVKGGRWFSLMDKVYAPGNLRDAFLGVVDADLKSYFDTIPHGLLLERVGAKVSDGKVLDLVGAFLAQDVMETAASWTPAGGTPQGGVISPLLSNIYLDPLDHQMEEAGVEMVRYADDFVIQPTQRPVNPLGGEPPTGEPDAGNSHVRFGGRGD